MAARDIANVLERVQVPSFARSRECGDDFKYGPTAALAHGCEAAGKVCRYQSGMAIPRQYRIYGPIFYGLGNPTFNRANRVQLPMGLRSGSRPDWGVAWKRSRA